MLTTSKNPRLGYLRRLLVLPLAAISLILFSFKYKEIKDKQKVPSPTHTTTTADDEFYGDTTKPKLYVQLNRTYKGSAIESIMPTTDMSGAIIKTVDDRTYFLSRAAAAKEFNFIITDSGFLAPPGAVLVTGERSIVTREGAFIRISPNSSFPQYPYTIDTTAYGLLSKEAKSYLMQDDKKIIIPNEDVHVDINITDGPLKTGKDINIDGLEKKLIFLDGIKIDLVKIKGLDLTSIKSMDVLKGESAVAKYGEAGKDGAIVITTKANKSIAGSPLYVLDGVESTKETVDHILPDNIQSVDVLKGEAAIKAYGEKGKNGVVKVTTKLAKNEVTFLEANKDNKLAEKVVIGHRITGDSSAAKTRITTPPVKQAENLKEVVVMGYETPKKYDQVFTKVEQPASFPSGLDGWRKYLSLKLQYPKAAQDNGTQGVVKVQMVVAEDGNVTELKALNDPGDGLAAEAERVIAKGPKWVPAMQNGRPVTYRFVQTLTFQLQ